MELSHKVNCEDWSKALYFCIFLMFGQQMGKKCLLCVWGSYLVTVNKIGAQLFSSLHFTSRSKSGCGFVCLHIFFSEDQVGFLAWCSMKVFFYRVPKNCKCAYTLNLDLYYPDPNYRLYSGKGSHKAKFLQVSVEDKIRQVDINFFFSWIHFLLYIENIWLCE